MIGAVHRGFLGSSVPGGGPLLEVLFGFSAPRILLPERHDPPSYDLFSNISFPWALDPLIPLAVLEPSTWVGISAAAFPSCFFFCFSSSGLIFSPLPIFWINGAAAPAFFFIVDWCRMRERILF